MDVEGRRQLLEASGLWVVDPAWEGAAVAPGEAWRKIILLDAIPTERVHYGDPSESFPVAQSRWRELAVEVGLFSEDKEFLISPSGAGTEVLPWALVRCENAMSLMEHIYQGGEFAAMSLDGKVVGGITLEEYEIWLFALPFAPHPSLRLSIDPPTEFMPVACFGEGF